MTEQVIIEMIDIIMRNLDADRLQLLLWFAEGLAKEKK